MDLYLFVEAKSHEVFSSFPCVQARYSDLPCKQTLDLLPYSIYCFIYSHNYYLSIQRIHPITIQFIAAVSFWSECWALAFFIKVTILKMCLSPNTLHSQLRDICVGNDNFKFHARSALFTDVPRAQDGHLSSPAVKEPYVHVCTPLCNDESFLFKEKSLDISCTYMVFCSPRTLEPKEMYMSKRVCWIHRQYSWNRA